MAPLPVCSHHCLAAAVCAPSRSPSLPPSLSAVVRPINRQLQHLLDPATALPGDDTRLSPGLSWPDALALGFYLFILVSSSLLVWEVLEPLILEKPLRPCSFEAVGNFPAHLQRSRVRVPGDPATSLTFHRSLPLPLPLVYCTIFIS